MKKWAKILCCFALMGAFLVGGLAGCGTVSDIKNKSEELIYNGNAATLVQTDKGNFLYFANAYASTAPTNEGEYSSSKRYSYLARVNGDDLQAKNAYFSPKNVENVSEEVTGYADSFMFVLGQNIYYATPNRQMVNVDGQAAYHFEYTCFYKSALNGDNKQKLYTTTGDISNLEVLKSGDTYYIVMLAGDRLVTINLSNGKAQTLATGVTSVALPKTYRKDVAGSTLDWNGQIYFTTARENTSGSDASTNLVKSIAVSSTNPEDAKVVYNQGTVTLFARERDVLFFTDKVGNGQTAVYLVDMASTTTNAFLPTSNSRKTVFEGESVDSTTISDLQLVTRQQTSSTGDTKTTLLGYVFRANSKFYYLTIGGEKGEFTFNEDMSSAKVLFVSGDTIYLSTTTGLFRASLSKIFSGEKTEATCNQIVQMTGISDSAWFAYDGEYLYFYATLQEVPEDLKDQDENSEENEDAEAETEETDENLYLHRAKANGTDEFELLGRTVIESRRTK